MAVVQDQPHWLQLLIGRPNVESSKLPSALGRHQRLGRSALEALKPDRCIDSNIFKLLVRFEVVNRTRPSIKRLNENSSRTS